MAVVTETGGDAESAIAQSRRMRARLLEGMLGLLRSQILPEVSTAEARDSAEHMARTLALMLVEAEWPSHSTAEYAERAGLAAPPPGSAPGEALIALRAEAAARGTAAVAAETWLQAQIAARRDKAGANPRPAEDPGLTESEVKMVLSGYLRERLGAGGLSIEKAEAIPGGRSKQTFLLRLTGGCGLPEQCVLRVDRKAALVPTRAAEEFELLRALWMRGGLAVPEPLLCEADTAVLGGTFIVVSLVEGQKGGEYFPEVYGWPQHAEAVCRDLARVLGRLHSIDLEALPVSLKRMTETAAFQEQILADYQRARAAGLRAAEFEAAYAWLNSNLASATAPARLCHGDIGLHNLLVADGRVTALLDWELAVAGPAAFDIASARHLVEPVMPWAQFVDEYRRAGGPPEAIEPRHLDFHTVLRRFRTNVASHCAAAMYRDRVSDDFVLANAGYDMPVRTRASLIEIVNRLDTAATREDD